MLTGSIASIKGWPDWSVYAASKAAPKDRQIRVNVLRTGQIATPIQEKLFDEETKVKFEALILRGKMGCPEEIATMALFLVSADSSYVNGMDLCVDGGTSAT